MVNPKVGIALGAAGVAVVLLPVLALFFMGGYNSPIQRFYDTPLAPGFPMGLMVTAVGAAVAAVGLLLFVRGMRSMPTYSPAPTVVRRPVRRGGEVSGLEKIEDELEAMFREERPAVEVRTVQPKPRQEKKLEAGGTPRADVKPEAEPAGTYIVVSKGVDMVCRTCGASNEIGARVCGQCGAKLYEPDSKTTPCPVCGAPVDETFKVGENIVCGVCFSELRLAKSIA
jgi:ribosomal protein L40E